MEDGACRLVRQVLQFVLIPFWFFSRLRARPELSRRMPTDDRFVLEDVIFRSVFLNLRFKRVLFVGCSEFTAWYPRLFAGRPSMRFETVDPSPQAAVFGATCHYSENFEDLSGKEDLVGQFDLIILNGVLNYGIDTRDQKQAAMRTASILLRPRGMLLVGFRDSPAANDFVPADMPEDLFNPSAIPGLDCHYYLTRSHNGHAFRCFERQ